MIAANSALAERDLVELADISTALARVLEGRGVDAGAARLVVDVAIAVPRRATNLWLSDPDARLSALVAQATDVVLAHPSSWSGGSLRTSGPRLWCTSG